jgi:hypothetical protein
MMGELFEWRLAVRSGMSAVMLTKAAGDLVGSTKVFQIDFVFNLSTQLRPISLFGGSYKVDVRELVTKADTELPISSGQVAAFTLRTALFPV